MYPYNFVLQRIVYALIGGAKQDGYANFEKAYWKTENTLNRTEIYYCKNEKHWIVACIYWKQLKNIESCKDQLKTNKKHWIMRYWKVGKCMNRAQIYWKQMKNIESCKHQLKTIKNIESCTIEKLKMHEWRTDLLKTNEKHWIVHRSIENKWKTLNRAKINWKRSKTLNRALLKSWKCTNRARIYWKQMKNIELCTDLLKTNENHWIVQRSIENN